MKAYLYAYHGDDPIRIELGESAFEKLMEARESMLAEITLVLTTQYGETQKDIPEKHLHLIH